MDQSPGLTRKAPKQTPNADSDEKKYCFEAACWNTVFPNCHELTQVGGPDMRCSLEVVGLTQDKKSIGLQVHRQRDNNFVDILNRVRRGEITSADLYKVREV